MRTYLIELEENERLTVAKSLGERRSKLVEQAGDTAENKSVRERSRQELDVLRSALRKVKGASNSQPNPG